MKPTRFRWVVMGIIAAITLVNYLDRAAIGFAAPDIRQELGIDPAALGFMMGAFGIGYFLSNPVCGYLMDHFGVRIVLTAGVLLWALSMGFTAAASVLAGLVLGRILLGVAEGGSFPAMSGVVTVWLAPNERATALALALAAVPLSLAFGGPALSLLIDSSGWRTAFALLAGVSALLAPIWWLIYRDRPSQSRFVNSLELTHISGDINETPEAATSKENHVELRDVLTNRTLIANNIAIFVFSYYLFFFVTWIPEYLRAELAIDLPAAGGVLFAMWGTAAVCLLMAGRLSDHILRRTGQLRLARSTLIWTTLLFSAAAILPLSIGGGGPLVIICLILSASILMAGLPASVAVNADIVPHRAALSHGIFTAYLAAGSFAAPALTGFLRTATGSFSSGFLLMAGLGFLGVLSTIFLHRPDHDRTLVELPARG